MKTPQKVTARGIVKEPPRYIAKISRRNPLQRVVWFLFRRYCLNEDRYKVTTRYTGPRPRHAYSTAKRDATAYRYYLDVRPQFTRSNVVRPPITAWRDMK